MTGAKRSQVLSFVLIAMFLLLGILAFVVILFSGLGRAVDGLERLEIVEVAELDLTAPGDYLVFLEQDGPASSFDSWQVVEQASQETVTLQPPRFRSSYSLRGRRGYSLFEFTAAKEGSYLISIGQPSERAFTVAMGKDYYRQTVVTVLTSLAVLVLFLVSAGVLIFKQIQHVFDRMP